MKYTTTKLIVGGHVLCAKFFGSVLCIEIELKITAICPNKSLPACFKCSDVKLVGEAYTRQCYVAYVHRHAAALACDSLSWLIWIVTMVKIMVTVQKLWEVKYALHTCPPTHIESYTANAWADSPMHP